MRVEERTFTVWVAEDGKEFDTPEECLRYEMSCAIADRIGNANEFYIPRDGLSANEIADWIIENLPFETEDCIIRFSHKVKIDFGE